jgi:hypothetical protein
VADFLAGKVAQVGENQIVSAFPRFWNRSEPLSLTFALETKPTAFQLRDARESRCAWAPSVSVAPPLGRIPAASAPSIAQ